MALSQGRFTYRHYQVLHCLASRLSEILVEVDTIHIYAGLPSMRASESPQGTIPSSLMVTPDHPDIVIHNETCNSVALLELTFPLDSMQHLGAARDRKQSKEENLQILPKLDCLGFPSHYDTIELSVLGHYLSSTLTLLRKTVHYFHQTISKSICRRLLDKAAGENFRFQLCRRFFWLEAV